MVVILDCLAAETLISLFSSLDISSIRSEIYLSWSSFSNASSVDEEDAAAFSILSTKPFFFFSTILSAASLSDLGLLVSSDVSSFLMSIDMEEDGNSSFLLVLPVSPYNLIFWEVSSLSIISVTIASLESFTISSLSITVLFTILFILVINLVSETLSKSLKLTLK